MKLFTGTPVDSLFIALFVAVVGIVIAQPCPEDQLAGCQLGCGNKKGTNDEFCKPKTADKNTTCNCEDTIGGRQETAIDGTAFSFVSTVGPCQMLTDQPPKCYPCEGSKVPYKCKFTGEIPGISSETSDDPDCYCAPEDAKSGVPAGEQKRRSKFPPILAKLLTALQQVRSKFRGRK